MINLLDLLIPRAEAYETAEHAHAVDFACSRHLNGLFSVVVHGINFTLGEISALAGDYFATPAELRAKAHEAREFLDRNAHEMRHEESIEEAEAGKLTDGKYFDLAIDNFSHFRQGEFNALKTCSYWHGQAVQAFPHDIASAFLFEGFALHFLVDMFAAGHMRTPRWSIYRHLRDNLSYQDRRAKIVSGLLSKLQHDEDNESGLVCDWVPVADLVGDTPALDKMNGKYYGDGHLKTLRASGSSLPYSHLCDTIVAHILHLFKHMVDQPEYPPLRRCYPWLRVGRRALTYERFIDACIPRPMVEHNSRGLMESVQDSSLGHPAVQVRWNGSTQKKIPGELTIDIYVKIDSMGVISNVALSLSIFDLPGNVIYINGTPIELKPTGTSRFFTFDGNDPRTEWLYAMVKDYYSD